MTHHYPHLLEHHHLSKLKVGGREVISWLRFSQVVPGPGGTLPPWMPSIVLESASLSDVHLPVATINLVTEEGQTFLNFFEITAKMKA